MKINWGTGIVISFLLFALAIAYIIIFPFNHKVDLVADDYYEKELKYQEQINRIERTAALKAEVAMERKGKFLHISFPKTLNNIEGEIFFYRPSDSSEDFIENIKTDSLSRQVFNISKLNPGLWRIKVLWHINEESFYSEKMVMM